MAHQADVNSLKTFTDIRDMMEPFHTQMATIDTEINKLEMYQVSVKLGAIAELSKLGVMDKDLIGFVIATP
jgi:hypothetical protein